MTKRWTNGWGIDKIYGVKAFEILDLMKSGQLRARTESGKNVVNRDGLMHGDELIPDAFYMSFTLPQQEHKAVDVLSTVKSFWFEIKEIEHIGFVALRNKNAEQNGLCLTEHQNDIVPAVDMTTPLSQVKKNLTTAQQDKLEACKIVDVYLQDCDSNKSVPSIKVAVDMVKKKYTRLLYKDQTIHNWIKKLFPLESRKPGRRTNKS